MEHMKQAADQGHWISVETESRAHTCGLYAEDDTAPASLCVNPLNL